MMLEKNREEKIRTITAAELKEMLERYCIGKKPLARLLGWGDTTIMNYLSGGDIPESEYAVRLYWLFLHASQYHELLEAKKDRLTDVAYRKSLSAVRRYILSGRLFVAAQYIINRSEGSISVSRLEAVLFFSQALSLGLYGKKIFDDDYYPDECHLPYRKLTERMRSEDCFVLALEENDLEAGDREILGAVFEAFEWYGPKSIAAVLEDEHCRLCARAGRHERRRASNGLIEKCYKDIFLKNHVNSAEDFSTYLNKRINALRRKLGK